jgi:hypothetical protein
MAKVEISVRSYATVYDRTGSQETSTEVLKLFHGLAYSDFDLGEDLAVDDRMDASLRGKLLLGGIMKLEFSEKEKALFVVTHYVFSEGLSGGEVQQLIRFTSGHWTDGIGASFSEEFLHDKGLRFEAVSDDAFTDVHAILDGDTRIARQFS